jgi:hypothetical protein
MLEVMRNVFFQFDMKTIFLPQTAEREKERKEIENFHFMRSVYVEKKKICHDINIQR